MKLSTVVHRAWPTYPRLCVRSDSHVLVVWPCGKAEHPLHVDHTLNVASYLLPEAEILFPATAELLRGLQVALDTTQEEAIRILLPHRKEIKSICDAAPTKLFSFTCNRPE